MRQQTRIVGSCRKELEVRAAHMQTAERKRLVEGIGIAAPELLEQSRLLR